MANSTTVDFNHRRQKRYAYTSAETGQSVDLTAGAGLAAKSKSVQENASILAASESSVKFSFANLGDTAKTPGVLAGMTGAPAIDEPASEYNCGSRLERLILELKLDNDDRQAKLAEERIEASKAAIDCKTVQMERQVAQTIQDMADAAQSTETMKIFGWALTGISIAAAVVTGGLAISAVVASSAASAGAAGTATATATVTATTGTATTATATTATATTATATASSAGSSLGQMGLSMGRQAIERTITAQVTKELGKAATKEVIKAAVAEKMAAVTTQQVAMAAVREGAKAAMFAAVIGTMQGLNEAGVTQKLAKNISWDKDGVSGQVMMMAAQIGITLGAGITLGPASMAGVGQLFSHMSTPMASVSKMAQTAVFTGMSGASTGLGIRNVFQQYEAQMSQAQSTELREQLTLVRQILEENQEDLQEIVNRITDTLSAAFAIIDSSNQVQKKIVEEMGSMA